MITFDLAAFTPPLRVPELASPPLVLRPYTVADLAMVRDRSSYEVHSVLGHIEVRWSHGRFGGLPEAKGYLDTPHHLVPGYFALR